MGKYKLEEKRMSTWDASEIFYRAWLPAGKAQRAVVIFHRGHEHSGRLLKMVEGLDLPDDFAVFAWDARGNGESPGPRDYADNFAVYAKDAETFVNYLAAEYEIPVTEMAVLANSVGGVIASTWVHDYAPRIRALVLAAPAFRIKLYVPLAIPFLRLALKLGVMKYVKSYVKSKVLTHDREEQERFNSDPQVTNSISTNILLDVYDTSSRIVTDAGAIRVPVLMLVAGSDWVVKTGAQKTFFDNLSSPVKEWEYYPDFYHAIFHELKRDLPLQRTREFILKQFAENSRPAPLLNADKSGYTKDEFDRLSKPSLNPLFACNRLALKTVARLSKGIRIGWRDGFDSGVTLDYVYRNRAEGITPLGRLIDYVYLNSIGWVGIRQRKRNLEEVLRKIINKVNDGKKKVVIVDIASGPGRYILETVKSIPDIEPKVLLRDYKKVNIEEGRKLIAELGLKDASMEFGDAFDRESLAAIQPRPSIAIVSGLYELIPDNDRIKKSLSGLADMMDEGSYLIYTNQPWHPQVEFIARVLRNREGKPWVMRRRTQEEMDDLVHAAGFEKISMEIDQWGIFTVSLARRTGS